MMGNKAHKFENFDDVLVGIQEIDAHHTQALELFNAIINVKEEEREHELKDLIKGLVEHWKMHFKYEEDLMQQYEYSGFDEHKKEHDRIMGDFLNYEEMLSKGFEYIISCLKTNLMIWIEEHIRHIEGNDKKLSKYLRSKGVA
jgi:hemerythrin